MHAHSSNHTVLTWVEGTWCERYIIILYIERGVGTTITTTQETFQQHIYILYTPMVYLTCGSLHMPEENEELRNRVTWAV